MDDFLPHNPFPWVISAFQNPGAFPEPADWLLVRLAAPSAEMRLELEGRGFSFLSGADCQERVKTLQAAEGLIDRLPTLAHAVQRHVRGFSLLKADEAYDISHSEPRWADWVFASCPAAPREFSTLRVLENVVHEAMHLQLTQLEAQIQLVSNEHAEMESPWKQEPRHLRGILHGLYVFRCITAFLNDVRLAPALGREGMAYVKRRTAEVAAEVQVIEVEALRQGLNPVGRAFLARIMP